MYNLQSSESTDLCYLIHKMIISEMKRKAPKSYAEGQNKDLRTKNFS